MLLVEDEAILAMGTASILGKRGYSVEHVFTGESALARMAEAPEGIDLILMDINLGEGMSGTEAAREILRSRDIPIVFLSSHTEESIVESTEEISSYGYVVKNSGITVLDASIRMAFRLFDARKSINAQNMAIEAANEQLRVTVEELTASNRRLASSEEKFFRVFRLIPDSITIDRLSDGVFIDANAGFTEMTGYAREEVAGRSSLPGGAGVWARTEDRETLVRRLAGAEETASLEAQFRRKDGSLFTGMISAKVIEIEGARCILSITRDITERKLADDLIKDSESRFRAAFANAPVGMALLSPSGDLRMMNRSFCAMLGYTMMEATSLDFKAHMHPEDLALGEEAVKNLLSGSRTTIRFIARYLHKEGRLVWVDESVSLLRSESIEAQGLIIHALDVSERKVGEERAARLVRVRAAVSEAMQLIVRETDFRRLLEGACSIAASRSGLRMAWIGLVDEDGGVARPFASAGAVDGYLDGLAIPISGSSAGRGPAETALRKGRLSVSPDIERDQRTEPWREGALARGYRSMAGFPLRSSSKVIGVFCFYSGELDFFDPEATGLLAQLAQDISFALDSMKSRELREDAERRLKESDQLYRESFRKSSAVKLLIDPATSEILDANIAASKFYGYAPERLVKMKVTDINASPLEEIRESLRSARASEENHFYFRHRLASGELRDVEVFSSPIEVGDRVLLHSIVHDISGRRRSEESLRRLLAEKDTLMKELQHRVKNNLNVVTSLLELEKGNSPGSKAGRVLSEAIARVRSISAIYERLYLSEDPESVDLALYVQDLAKSLFSTYNLDPARITLGLSADRVLLDTKRSVPLGLILNELLSNALKYAYDPSGEGGEVRVELAEKGGRISLRVSDDGAGIPDGFLGPDSPSMGITLVRLLAQQLDAELRIENSGGTRALISFSA